MLSTKMKCYFTSWWLVVGDVKYQDEMVLHILVVGDVKYQDEMVLHIFVVGDVYFPCVGIGQYMDNSQKNNNI